MASVRPKLSGSTSPVQPPISIPMNQRSSACQLNLPAPPKLCEPRNGSKRHPGPRSTLPPFGTTNASALASKGESATDTAKAAATTSRHRLQTKATLHLLITYPFSTKTRSFPFSSTRASDPSARPRGRALSHRRDGETSTGDGTRQGHRCRPESSVDPPAPEPYRSIRSIRLPSRQGPEGR